MDCKLGLYEQIINKLISQKLELLAADEFFIEKSPLDKEEAASYLSLYVADLIRFALNEISDHDRPYKQIELSNKIISLLSKELNNNDICNNLIEAQGRILQAIVSKISFPFPDISKRIKQITPLTRFSQSELFTGSNAGISIDSELRKEILSSDEICWLVSFIKFSGIRIFMNELKEFTSRGCKMRIITSSYMGATDAKAVEYLSQLPNTEIKVSYNNNNERLHAKAYLFLRNSGFNTAYIGSSNISHSALSKGLEWNLKVTTKEIGHIIDKFQKTFETLWADADFETYDFKIDREKLHRSLRLNRSPGDYKGFTFFDLKPYPFQIEILEKLQVERNLQNRYANLIVAATGTGKTMISAFDFKDFSAQNRNVHFLFVAHRKEILEQAQDCFRHVLRDANFGELWVDGLIPQSNQAVFASVQTLNNQLDELKLASDYYDYIVIDEVHHITAKSYRPILSHFLPKILLGLTATPERQDQEDILEDFCGVIAAEIRLPEALNRKLLCPFQYFALSDSVDISRVSWRQGKYDVAELTRLYTEHNRRVIEVISNCEKYLTDLTEVRALAYCVSQEHARFMSDEFNRAGLKAAFLTSRNSSDRAIIRHQLMDKEINFLFVVDIFNEGVDVPEIDTVLFLRPTESLTVFLQQLGRGLRLAPKKETLTVLDFVGNARPEYDFEQKFRALIGRTHTSVYKELQNDFPHLPLGCSIVLEKEARKTILRNIKNIIEFRKAALIKKIQNFKYQSALELSLKNFMEFYHIDLPIIYKRDLWKRLCADAGLIPNFESAYEKNVKVCLSKKLMACNSMSYFKFIKRLLKPGFDYDNIAENERLMLIMFHYDLWQKAGTNLGMESVQEGVDLIRNKPVFIQEMIEYIDLRISKLDVLEKTIDLGFDCPLKVHARYNRDQILAALQFHSFETASSNREGVAFNRVLNTEALFITLKKSDQDYSPTTMYDDYSINDVLFHWQSQNSTSPESVKGKSYINHEQMQKKILMFVRERKKDEHGNTMGFVFLGDVSYVNSNGSRPMNIKWRLKERIPSYLLKDSGKLQVG